MILRQLGVFYVQLSPWNRISVQIVFYYYFVIFITTLFYNIIILFYWCYIWSDQNTQSHMSWKYSGNWKVSVGK